MTLYTGKCYKCERSMKIDQGRIMCVSLSAVKAYIRYLENKDMSKVMVFSCPEFKEGGPR